MLDIYATLEIEQILKEVESYSFSELAKERIRNLKMIQTVDEAIFENELLNEMIVLIYRHGKLPLENSFDLIKIIDFANKGGILTPLDLEKVANDILISIRINEYFTNIEKNDFFKLKEITANFNNLGDLENEIHRIITKNLSISDDASSTLSHIRKQIIAKEDELRRLTLSLVNRYKDNLNESTYTIRNNHFVLPFKSSEKNKINGIIHDISDSGLTTYIEPSPLVELSNNIVLLRLKEKEEIQRILLEITRKVISSKDSIIENNQIIATLDFLSSKARYAIDNEHEVVDFVKDEKIIELENARHPSIKKEKVIANSFYLNSKQRIIIISGPNAGGKTVAIKTLGILVMMAKMGLGIPTSKKGRMSFFPKIFADIGDNQSLSDNLSTFSAHISNISRITHYVKSDDLVLIDELGTGTSPKEGEAIAIAVINYLFKKECFAIISSHFDKVKEYAYSKDAIENAMMIFDDKNLLPTYKLQIGLPGRSYGLEMAKRYHLNDEIIKDAKSRLNKNKDNDINDVIEKLNSLVIQNNELNLDLKERTRQIEYKENELNKKEINLKNKKDNLLSDVNETKERMIFEVQEEIRKALNVLTNPNIKQKDLIETKKKLEKFESSDEEIYSDEIKINDYVESPEIGLIGKVVEIKGEKITLLTPDGMSVKTSKKKVALTKDIPTHRVFNNTIDNQLIKTNVGLELNIIGEHIDEGINKLAKYLDDARIKHFSSVRIIHGKGSGKLRSAVHKYLSTCSFVKEYHVAGYYDGGDGATIVTFK